MTHPKETGNLGKNNYKEAKWQRVQRIFTCILATPPKASELSNTRHKPQSALSIHRATLTPEWTGCNENPSLLRDKMLFLQTNPAERLPP